MKQTLEKIIDMPTIEHNFRMKSILTGWVLFLCIGVTAQLPHTDFSLASGVMKVIIKDDAISPYIFSGTTGLFRLDASIQKKLSEHNLQFSFGSLTLKSDNSNIYSIPSKFYFLQYSFQQQILTHYKTLIWVGPAISNSAFIRNANSVTTGELNGSFELRMQALRAISKLSHVGIALNLPIASFLVHRNYGLSELESEIVSWGKFRSFQLQLTYLLSISDHFDFVLGYDLLYYNYNFEEPVLMNNQQYFCGLKFNFKKGIHEK